MTKNALVPLHPVLLPQQRIYEVVGLPPRPDPFEVFIGSPGGNRRDDLPTRKPRSSRYLCQVEWAWSPYHGRIDAYYLHRTRSGWLLWIAEFDDNNTPWRWNWSVAAGVNQRGLAVLQPSRFSG